MHPMWDVRERQRQRQRRKEFRMPASVWEWAVGRAELPPTGRGRLRVGQVKVRISGDQFGQGKLEWPGGAGEEEDGCVALEPRGDVQVGDIWGSPA